MGKTILPPGASTFLSSQKGAQVNSALSSVYQNTMVETAVLEYLTRLGIDLGVPKPLALFSDDNLWRAVVRALAFEKRHTRTGVAKVLELILKPQVSQTTVLQRTTYANISVGDTLVIPAGTNAGSYSVAEVLTHHLIFPAGTFSVPDINVGYTIEGISDVGSLVALADGRHALVDYTVSFVNTHPFDFLTKLNKSIPQYGKVVFNKNSNVSSVESKTFNYEFYDRNLTGILKLDSTGPGAPVTYNKWLPIQSSTLSSDATNGGLTLGIKSPSNFPTSLAPVQAVQALTDSVVVLTPGVAGGPFSINSVTKHEITLGAPSFTVPASPTTTNITYEIETVAGSGFLSGGRGHFLSKKGKILSTTKLFDPTVDFTQLIRPHVTGSTEPFLVTVNRGEANEETVEVIYRNGTTLHLVPDPNDATGATSLLKYNHTIGESVEVYNKNTSTAGTYFPLSAAGATVSTATAGSTTTALFDSTNPFVALNASVTFGDEVELVTVPAGSANPVGERRQIATFTAANQVGVTPAFADTLLGCTYRIRKLYKAGADNYLYVTDSSVFPAENFSIILNRGKDDEEVVWCGTASNNLTLNRLTIANNDLSTAFVSKDHNFGITVEPAQILIESCNWEIIETRATGEYTVALEPACAPQHESSGWFLHEKSPDWLMSASSGPAGAATQISVSGRFVGSLHVPQCNPVANFSATDSQITVSGDDFLRMFANKPDAHSTKSIHEVFRSIVIRATTPDVTQENFIVRADRIATLVKNARIGDSTIYTDKQLIAAGDNVYKLGAAGNAYPTSYTPGSPPTLSRVSTVTVTASVLDLATGWYANTLSVALTDVNHFEGESLINEKTPLILNRPIGFTCTTLGTCDITLLSNLPDYRYLDGLTNTSESVTFTNGVLPIARNDYVVCTTGQYIPRSVIGNMLYITTASNATAGERRRISSIGGPNNNYIFVDTDFSLQVPPGATFCIEGLLQTADSQISSVVPLGDSNSAFPVALNSKNLNLYNGGHKSIFLGSYVYDLLNEDSEPVDQPGSGTAFLLNSHDIGTPSATYKFPGPRRIIAPPALPFSTTTSLGTSLTSMLDVVGLDPANAVWTAMAPGTPLVNNDSRIVGKFVQILDNQRSDWRKTFKIDTYDAATRRIGVASNFDSVMLISTPYRILGDSGTPVLVPGQTSFWADYPEFFPDPAQGNFTITLARGTSREIDLNINSCVNSFGVNYGFFDIGTTSPNIADNYYAGDSLELKVTKIALPSVGSLPTLEGGFYCEFGYEEEALTQEESGVSNYLGNTYPPRYFGSTESTVSYSSISDPLNLNNGLYNKIAGELILPVATTKTVAFRSVTTLDVSAASNFTDPSLGAVTEILIFGDNFIDKRFEDASLGGDLQIQAMVGTVPHLLSLTIKKVLPGVGAGCLVLVSPQIDFATYSNILAGAVVTVKAPMRSDDHEALLKESVYVGLKQALTTSKVENRQYVNLNSSGGALNYITCADIAPVSTALIGRQVKITDYTGASPAAAGDVRTIVAIEGTAFDRLRVDSNFGVAIALNTTFEILPSKNPLYGFPRGSHSDVGGVYTPVAHDGVPGSATPMLFGAPAYPTGNSSTNRFPAGREYGIVEEYVKFSKRVNNILTLSNPYYFKYDHPSGSRVTFGTGEKFTAGDGTDHRPYVFSSGYLALLFSDAAGFKNLFTAAGIECKTEETELGP